MENTQLKSYIDRIEALIVEKKDRMEDIKSVYLEATNDGFNKKILATVIKLRAIDPQERELIQAEIDTYMEALGG